MKARLYQQPQTKVIFITTRPILVISENNGDVGSVSVSSDDYSSDKGNILSRKTGFWDDED